MDRDNAPPIAPLAEATTKVGDFWHGQNKVLDCVQRVAPGVGRPGEVIGRFARKLDVRGVISGTRGHGGVVGVLLGSVAQDILAHVDVPITLVK